MSFIRPEAKEALWRWREVLAAAGLAALGLWWVVSGYGLLAAVGWAMTALAGAVAVIGVQRARFRMDGGGPGYVTVDEGQITYFGPFTCGVVAVSEIERVTLDPGAKPSHWVLQQDGRPPLRIPVNAAGAEALFDVFAALPGLRTERMLAELNRRGPHPVVIWERRSSRPQVQWLH